MRLPRAARTGILTLAALTGTLCLAGPSMAAEGYTLTSYIGSQGTGNGQFQGPLGVAVNGTTGDIYVADSANNRVQELNSEGAYIAQFNGGPEHALAEPSEIAVDNSPTSPAKGDVYVYDRGHQVIDVFDSEGEFLRKLPVVFSQGHEQGFYRVEGIAVDMLGDVWVAGETYEGGGELVQEFNDDGSLVTSAELVEGGNNLHSAPGIAVDSQGDVYMQNTSTGVKKYNSQLEVVGSLSQGERDYSTALAVGSLTGNVFLDEGKEIVECAPFAEPSSCEVDTFGGSEGIGSSENLGGSRGIAVDGSDTVFASEYGENRIAVFKVGVLPVVRTGPASVVERKGATVVGTIKRGGQPSVYYVQYGVGNSLSSSTSPVGIPGETEEEVHVSLIGLNAVTTYSYRLVVEAENGVRYYGPVEKFTTLPAVEGVSTGPAMSVTGTAARLTGALEPNGYEAHYFFQYGAEGEGYALTSPVFPGLDAVDAGSAFASVPAETGLSRLVPNTAYHFRLVTTNALGVTYGQEETFATLPVEPTAVVQPALLVGLHEATLSGVIDPEHSDTHYHFLFGTSTSYGESLPAEEEADLGSSFANRSVTMQVAGLTPGTTYHYALVASNSQGTVQTADQTFTTPTLAALLPEVATGAASEVSPNAASISGTVDPRGVPTNYEFDIGTDTTYGSRVFGEAGSGTQPRTLTLSLQGLAAGTLYHYRLVASNKYTTVYGADETFTTPGFPTALLASPVGAPLVPAPAFNPPSTRSTVTVSPAPKHKSKVKHKAKQKRRKVKQYAHKASSGASAHGNDGGGR